MAWITDLEEQLVIVGVQAYSCLVCLTSYHGLCQNHFLQALMKSQTWTQPFRLSPSVTRSDWGEDYFGGIHIDFQAGEPVSPAHNYIYTFECHMIIYVKWFMTMIHSNSRITLVPLPIGLLIHL